MKGSEESLPFWDKLRDAKVYILGTDGEMTLT
jgi:hypothetical protein